MSNLKQQNWLTNTRLKPFEDDIHINKRLRPTLRPTPSYSTAAPLDLQRAIRLLVEAAEEGSSVGAAVGVAGDAMCALGIASEDIGDVEEAKIW